MRYAALLLLAVSLLVRGTIPNGWMPDDGRMVLCTVAGPVFVADPFAPAEAPEPQSEAFCIFALGAHAAPPPPADASASLFVHGTAEPLSPTSSITPAPLDAACARAPPPVV